MMRRVRPYTTMASSLGTILLLTICSSTNAEAWVHQRTMDPFVFRANFHLAQHQELFDELMQIRRDLQRYLGVKPSQEPIELYLFRNQTTYRQYLRKHFPKVPYRRAIFIKTKGPGMVFAYLHQDFAVDLRHEATHALLHASLPMVPLWLDEGLAEYFEVPSDQRAFHPTHLSALKWNLRFGMFPHLKRLENRRDLSEMGSKEYRYAWAWVHFMLHGPAPAHDELVRYLADIQAGTAPGLLSQRLTRRIPKVEKSLVQHFKSWKRREA